MAQRTRLPRLGRPNSAFERSAGSPPHAAAAHRERWTVSWDERKKVLREGRRHGLFLTPKRVWLDLVAYGEPAKGRARRGLRRSPPSQR